MFGIMFWGSGEATYQDAWYAYLLGRLHMDTAAVAWNHHTRQVAADLPLSRGD